ncbi:hypothetical protein FH972_002619 [Carpinus fangiana]|uniref:3-hydroxyacyl-CoA dehydrogenase NAD binding domain-containing protein n=1 Tax=Carpinus fangiana TaxID=176857 RepID=A0A5N6QIV5_9ROSI|nr:hypothetical protein FH972_002619 [Carpinus fangiana]
MERITSSPENPSPLVLHTLASLLETQESSCAFTFFPLILALHGKKQEVRDVPKGCLVIKVGQGEEQQRFVVLVIYFNHPLFMQLLKEAEEECGFDQKGTITIPCHVEEFRNVQGMIDREKSLHHHHAVISCFREKIIIAGNNLKCLRHQHRLMGFLRFDFSVVPSHSMMKFESGYTVETVFDGTNLQSSVKEGKMFEKDLENTISTLKGVFDYESFKDMDMVIEDAIENVSLKQQIFADLEKYCPPHCILVSNTSTIDLSLIGERIKSQDRIVGAHFFSSPAQRLLEIVRTRQTSPQVVVDLLDVVEKIKKTPVVVGDCTGFAVNRMLFPYAQAATLLVERGADLNQIDRAITEFGMPMSPFRLRKII